MAQALELSVTAWSPLGGRLLAIADAVNAVAAQRGASSAQVAIAWIRAQRARGVIVPMLGARHRKQLEDNLGALSLELTAAELDRLEQVSRIELGFPDDFGADRLAYGDTRPLMDSQRPHGPQFRSRP